MKNKGMELPQGRISWHGMNFGIFEIFHPLLSRPKTYRRYGKYDMVSTACNVRTHAGRQAGRQVGRQAGR
jgi:hypothetical protein